MDHKKLLELLNEKLREKGIRLTLICVGGFVMEFHGLRSTLDIDAFYTETPEIRQIIKDVGDAFGITSGDEPWLNHSVQNLNETPPAEICKEVYALSNLKILFPPLDYIAGMKIKSGRRQDVMDAAMIISFLHIVSPKAFLSNMQRYNLGDLDDAVLMDAFGMAYGMEWMENYYRENESQIISSIYASSIPSEMKGLGATAHSRQNA